MASCGARPYIKDLPVVTLIFRSSTRIGIETASLIQSSTKHRTCNLKAHALQAIDYWLYNFILFTMSRQQLSRALLLSLFVFTLFCITTLALPTGHTGDLATLPGKYQQSSTPHTSANLSRDCYHPMDRSHHGHIRPQKTPIWHLPRQLYSSSPSGGSSGG